MPWYMDDAVAPVSVTATHYDGSQVTADADTGRCLRCARKTLHRRWMACVTRRSSFPPGLGNGFPRFVAEIRTKIAQTSGGTLTHAERRGFAWLITQRLRDRSTGRLSPAAATASGDTMVGSRPQEKKRISADLGQRTTTSHSGFSLLLGYTGCALWYDNGEWGITAETAVRRRSPSPKR